MSHDEPWLREAVLASPDDDAPRLAYAQWCGEHGQSERAELIRVQLQLARSLSSDPRRPEWIRRSDELLRAHGAGWVATLVAELELPGIAWVFRRGFVELAEFPTYNGIEQLLARLEVASLFEPIRGIAFAPENDRQYAELAAAPSLAWLSELHLSELHFKNGQAPLGRLLISPHLTGLKRLHISLDMYSPPLEARVFARIANNPALAGLTELRVHCDVMEANFGDLFRTLGTTAHLERLSSLELGHDWLAAIAETPLASRLSNLTIPFGCGLGCVHGKKTRRSESLATRLRQAFRRHQLQRLTVRGGDEMPEGERQELREWFGEGVVDFAPGNWSEYRQCGMNFVCI